MPDPTPVIDPNAPPALPPAAPPPGTPPVAVQPPPGVPPAAAPPRAGEKFIRIPQRDFKTRVQREAKKQTAEIVQQELGCSLEEAKAVLAAQRAAAGAAPAAGDPGRAATPPADDLQKKLAETQAALAESQARATEEERKRKSAQNRHKNDRMEAEFKLEAIRSGIKGDEQVDAAISMYRAAVLKTPDDQVPPQPSVYFSDLVKRIPGFAEAGAGAAPPVVVPVPASTAPPAAAGDPPPVATPSGQPKKPKDAASMSPEEFNRYSRETYGYTPGAQ